MRSLPIFKPQSPTAHVSVNTLSGATHPCGHWGRQQCARKQCSRKVTLYADTVWEGKKTWWREGCRTGLPGEPMRCLGGGWNDKKEGRGVGEGRGGQSVKAGRGCAAGIGRQGWGLGCDAERWGPGSRRLEGVGLWGQWGAWVLLLSVARHIRQVTWPNLSFSKTCLAAVRRIEGRWWEGRGWGGGCRGKGCEGPPGAGTGQGTRWECGSKVTYTAHPTSHSCPIHHVLCLQAKQAAKRSEPTEDVFGHVPAPGRWGTLRWKSPDRGRGPGKSRRWPGCQLRGVLIREEASAWARAVSHLQLCRLTKRNGERVAAGAAAGRRHRGCTQLWGLGSGRRKGIVSPRLWWRRWRHLDHGRRGVWKREERARGSSQGRASGQKRRTPRNEMTFFS